MVSEPSETTEDRIRILLVDDEALVRAGLRLLLATTPDLEVIGEAEDGVAAVDRVRTRPRRTWSCWTSGCRSSTGSARSR